MKIEWSSTGVSPELDWTRIQYFQSSPPESKRPRRENTPTILRFKVGEELYGLDQSYLQEILPFRREEAVLVPGASKFSVGVVDLRGLPVGVLEMATILGEKSEERPVSPLLIAECEPAVAFLVDSVEGVTVTDLSTLKPAKKKHELIQGQDPEGYHLLDVPRLLSQEYLRSLN